VNGQGIIFMFSVWLCLAVSGCVFPRGTKLRLAGLEGLVGRPGDLGPRRWLPDVTMGFSEILRKKKTRPEKKNKKTLTR
jgi:hypothetical protein